MRPLLPFIAFGLLLQGCSLFEPREAQRPSQIVGVDFGSYTDILGKVVDIYRTGKASDLVLVLADDFIFEGDTLDSAGLNATSRLWGIGVEKQVTATMLADSLHWLEWENSSAMRTLADFSDSAVVRWDYDLTLRDSSRIEGTSLFTLVRRDNRFYLIYWQDRINPATSGAKSIGRWKMENN
jgi:hypothetical protein